MNCIRGLQPLASAAAIVLLALPAAGDAGSSLDRKGSQWSPFIEWSLKNDSYEGNPFDLMASVTFVHQASGEKYTTGMFYDGGSAWKFRFTGTRVGKWSFTTSSTDSDLDGQRGSVLVAPNDSALGFVSHAGSKWVRARGSTRELRAFVPQFVMYDGPAAFYRKPQKINADIQTFLVEHGFTGFHVPVFCRWFDLDQESARGITQRHADPDSRTFEALELLITKVHAAGGVVHLWMWGDEQRQMTPVRWGINGKVDRRLQRYLAARLGPIPGWTMGYGFDLDEWVNESQLAKWRDSMHTFLGWPHMLGARHGDPNQGLDHSSAISWNGRLDYSSYEHHRPTYNVYVASLNAIGGQPVLSEDRFRIRQSSRYAAKDYSMEQTRRGLWNSTMAGGVANIWGNLVGPDGSVDTNRYGSFRYPKPHWIKTHAEFFRNRFVIDLQRDHSMTDGVCLRRSRHEGYVFYQEDADALRMDLTKMAVPAEAIAVDALKAYEEIEVGKLLPKSHVWKAPYRSDWAIGVGTFDVGGIANPSHSAAAFTNITESAGTGGPTERARTGGHGAMFADVDGDGRPDLYITMIFKELMPELFYRNLGGGRFAEEGKDRGVADFDGGSHGACFADLDNDGDYDLFNGTTWDQPSYPSVNNVFRNDGTGRFQDVTASSGIPSDRRWPTRSVLTFDLDGDGDLDLFGVTNYQGSADPTDERNEVYRNDGGLKFTPVRAGDLFTAPCGQGATDTDFDGDGDIDVIAANRTGPVNVLRNEGTGNFTRVAPDSIGLRHGAGDGVSIADVDNDGDSDMLLASDDVGYLYSNRGDGTFRLRQSFTGTAGYMGGFADLDNDRDVDLVFAGDDVCYLNDGTGEFTEGPSIPVGDINDPRGIAFADIDNDGDLDFAIGCKRSQNCLIRNDLPGGNWLKVRLISPQGQAGAFGAKIRIHEVDQAGTKLLGLREARSNTGYLSQNDPVLHFGLGAHEQVRVLVKFLDGTTITRSDVAAGQTILIDGRNL
jgi:hypothetical protein